MDENISVAVRVRPLSEKEESDSFSWETDGVSIWQKSKPETQYQVDQVFGPASTTRSIYESTFLPLIEKVVCGFNATVFAYGQTSSGKTYTMQGTESDPGVIPSAVRDVFQFIGNYPTREFLIRVSYMELYNEEVNDLLYPENMKLPIHESKVSGVYVAGLTEEIVNGPESVLECVAKGDRSRHIASTRMNERSSRSHTVFRMIVESRAKGDESDGDPDAVWVSTLTLVDLAGSERVAKTGAEGLRMKEGTAINNSLLTLGIVINQLATKAGAVSYRASKLTRILQPSLGGNTKTAILCNVTPAAFHVEESSNTLRFACRAKKVVNNATINEVLSDAALLKRQAKEIKQLKKRLAGSGNTDVEEQIGKLRGQMLRMEQEKELMEIKLEEEKAQREKAQRQVQVAAKVFLENKPTGEDDSNRSKRRDTWCPGNVPMPGLKRAPQSQPPAPPPTKPAEKVDIDVMLMPPPPSKRKLNAIPEGEERSKAPRTDADETVKDSDENIPKDPVALNSMVSKLLEERTALGEQIQGLLQTKEENSAHIRNLQTDLAATLAMAKNSVGDADEQAFNQARAVVEKRFNNDKKISIMKQAVQACQIKELNGDRESLLMQNRQLNAFVRKWKSQAIALREDNYEKENWSNTLLAEIEDLQKAHDAANLVIREKDAEIESLKSGIAKAQEEVDRSKESGQDIENELLVLKEQHEQALSEYQQQIEDLKKARDEVEEKLSSTQTSKDELREAKLKHRQEVQSMRKGTKDRDLLSKELDRAKKKADDSEAKVRSLIRERMDLQSEKNTLQRQIKSLERTTQAMEKDSDKKDTVHEKQRETLSTDLAKTKEKLAETQKKLKDTKTEQQQLESDLATQKEECASLKKQLDEALSDSAVLRQTNMRVNSELAQAKEQIMDFQDIEGELRGDMEELKLQLEELLDDREVKLAELENMQKSKNEVSGQLHALKEQLETVMQDARDELEFKKDEMEILREELLAKIDTANAELSEAKTELEKTVGQLENLEEQRSEEMATAENTIKGDRAKIAELEAQTKKLENEVQHLMDNLKQRDQELSKVSGEAGELDKKCKELQKSIESAFEQIGKLEDEMAKKCWASEQKLEKQQQEHEKAVGEWSVKYKQASQDVGLLKESLEKEGKNAKEAKEEMGAQINALKQELESVQTKLGKMQGQLEEGKKIQSQSDAQIVELTQEKLRLLDESFHQQKELEARHKELEALKSELENHKETSRLEISELEKANTQKLQRQKEELEVELDNAVKDIKSGQEKCTELQAEIKRYMEFKEMAKTAMIKKKKECARAEDKLIEKTAGMEKLEKALRENQLKIKHLEEQIAMWQEKLRLRNQSCLKEIEGKAVELAKQLEQQGTSAQSWIQYLVNRVWEADFSVKELEADFNSNGGHIPTVLENKQIVEALHDKLTAANNDAQKLQMSIRRIERDLAKNGCDKDQIAVLVAKAQENCDMKWSKAATEQMRQELNQKCRDNRSLSMKIRKLEKQIPPEKITVDLSTQPPVSENKTSKAAVGVAMSNTVNLPEGSAVQGKSKPPLAPKSSNP